MTTETPTSNWILGCPFNDYRWVDVRDRLPKDGVTDADGQAEMVLVWVFRALGFGYLYEGEWNVLHLGGGDWRKTSQVTHWMKTPPPPRGTIEVGELYWEGKR